MNKEQIEEIVGERMESSIVGTGKIRTVSGKTYFVKTGNGSEAYRCEANGLRELEKTGVIRVPETIGAGDDYMVTEYIENRSPDREFFKEFGRQLAQMHRYTSDGFGFYENNFIGQNPQPNIPSGSEAHDWGIFYWNKRLLFQYRLAESNGYATVALKHAFLHLESRIGMFFAESEEPPALLHGDLWAGNFLCDAQNAPVLIDPAVYYGHREADLAMTKLFGGFPPAFYEAYQQEYPLPEGWQRRENLYLLYHVMNHLNLFGHGYLRQAEHLAASY